MRKSGWLPWNVSGRVVKGVETRSRGSGRSRSLRARLKGLNFSGNGNTSPFRDSWICLVRLQGPDIWWDCNTGEEIFFENKFIRHESVDICDHFNFWSIFQHGILEVFDIGNHIRKNRLKRWMWDFCNNLSSMECFEVLGWLFLVAFYSLNEFMAKLIAFWM